MAARHTHAFVSTGLFSHRKTCRQSELQLGTSEGCTRSLTTRSWRPRTCVPQQPLQSSPCGRTGVCCGAACRASAVSLCTLSLGWAALFRTVTNTYRPDPRKAASLTPFPLLSSRTRPGPALPAPHGLSPLPCLTH